MSKPEAPEFQIERDYDNRCAHARSMYHMAVQRAESKLDVALGVADGIRQAKLADLRHQSHEPVTPTIEDVAMVARPIRSAEEIKRDLAKHEYYAVNRLTEIQP